MIRRSVAARLLPLSTVFLAFLSTATAKTVPGRSHRFGRTPDGGRPARAPLPASSPAAVEKDPRCDPPEPDAASCVSVTAPRGRGAEIRKRMDDLLKVSGAYCGPQTSLMALAGRGVADVPGIEDASAASSWWFGFQFALPADGIGAGRPAFIWGNNASNDELVLLKELGFDGDRAEAKIAAKAERGDAERADLEKRMRSVIESRFLPALRKNTPVVLASRQHRFLVDKVCGNDLYAYDVGDSDPLPPGLDPRDFKLGLGCRRKLDTTVLLDELKWQDVGFRNLIVNESERMAAREPDWRSVWRRSAAKVRGTAAEQASTTSPYPETSYGLAGMERLSKNLRNVAASPESLSQLGLACSMAEVYRKHASAYLAKDARPAAARDALRAAGLQFRTASHRFSEIKRIAFTALARRESAESVERRLTPEVEALIEAETRAAEFLEQAASQP